jgi:hypothetical protein
MVLFQGFDKRVFIVLSLLLGLFTIVSFWALVADGENGPFSNIWINLLVKSFDLARWPTLYLYNWNESSLEMGLLGLLMNVVLNAYILERIIYFTKYVFFKTR